MWTKNIVILFLNGASVVVETCGPRDTSEHQDNDSLAFLANELAATRIRDVPIQFSPPQPPNEHGCLGRLCTPVVATLQFHPALRR